MSLLQFLSLVHNFKTIFHDGRIFLSPWTKFNGRNYPISLQFNISLVKLKKFKTLFEFKRSESGFECNFP